MVSEEELDDLARRAGLHRPVNAAVVDDEGVRDALASVRVRIESGAPASAPSRAATRPVDRRWWAVLGAAVAAVGVASLVGVESLTGGSGGSGLPLAVSPAAAAQLDRVAHVAASQPGLSAGQWLYVDVTQHAEASEPAGDAAGGTTVAYSFVQNDQTWSDGNGDQRSRAVNSDFAFATPQDQAAYQADEHAFRAAHAEATDGVLSDNVSHGSEPTQPWETSPPSDPQKLLSELSASHSAADTAALTGKLPAADLTADVKSIATNPGVLWSDLTSILGETAAPAQLRSTAIAALKYLPHTTVLGNQTDGLGRSGVAISFTGVGQNRTETAIVDPSNGQLLETDDTLQTASGPYPAGTVVSRVDYEQGIVGSDTALPGGGSVPLPGSLPTSTTRSTTSTTPSTTSTAG